MFVADYRCLPAKPDLFKAKRQPYDFKDRICRYLFPGIYRLFTKNLPDLQSPGSKVLFQSKHLFLASRNKLFDLSSFTAFTLLRGYRNWLRQWVKSVIVVNRESSAVAERTLGELPFSVFDRRLNCPPSMSQFLVNNSESAPFKYKPCRFRLCPFCTFRLALRLFHRLQRAKKCLAVASKFQLPLRAHLVHFDFDYLEKDKLMKFKRKLFLLNRKGVKRWFGSLGLAVNYRPYFYEDKNKSPVIRVSVLFLHARSFYVNRCIRYLQHYRGGQLCAKPFGKRYNKLTPKAIARLVGSFYDLGYYLFFNRLETGDLYKIYLDHQSSFRRRYTGILRKDGAEEKIRNYLSQPLCCKKHGLSKSEMLKKIQLEGMKRAFDSADPGASITESAFDKPVKRSRRRG